MILKKMHKVFRAVNFSFFALGLMLIFTTISCKKFVEINAPSGSIAENNVYTIDATAISVLNGIYTNMCKNNTGPFTGFSSISLFAGLSADELTPYSGAINTSYDAYYRNALSVTSAPIAGSEEWTPLYKFIFYCNAAIEGLTSSKADALTPIIRNQLLGEAKFMRAFFYFYLVNLYGDLPLVLTTDPQINTMLARSSKETVYSKMVQDCMEAKELLSSYYLNETLLTNSPERIRPTKWSATALLARIYLYQGEWSKAENESSIIISNSGLFSLSPLNSVFLKASLGNNEAIFQIQPSATGFNTQEPLTYIITSTNGLSSTRPVFISNFLLNSFEPGDQRAKPKNWIDTITVLGSLIRFPYKYKTNIVSDANINSTSGSSNMKEFLTLFRLGEQYLIRAEARAQQNNLGGAIDDLNKIRQRAGLPLIAVTNPAISQTALLDKIIHERQVELFTEFGFRWLDLKRTGKVDDVMNVITPLKAAGTSWQHYQALYPLPQNDLDNMPNLLQNFGY